MDLQTFNRLLAIGFEKGVSDVHFQVGYPPLFRARGQLIRSKLDALTSDDTASIVNFILESQKRKPPENFKELDTSYAVPKVGRFRVSVFRQSFNFGIVMRAIPLKIRAVGELNLPPVLEEIANSQRGLILVTGPTGAGKSTTVAAMIKHMNDSRYANILTIEDPIEFQFPPGNSCIFQREVGVDTDSYSAAIRAAMRMDPDIMMVGELRDHETIDACMKAAETGHLVLSTMHTNNSVSTINRILSYFPAEAQELVHQRLADILVALVSLRLLVNKSGDGVVPAVEIMRKSPSIEACIREMGRLNEIPKVMEKSSDQKMQTFDQHLLELYKKGLVSLDEAVEASSSSDLQRNLMVTN